MTLKTLGGLALEPALFTQPKPLLLLAYLALEGPQQRRHLAELFWQGGNRMKSLSMTLTRLHQGAGEVVRADDKRVWASLTSDAGTLLGALEVRDWQRATQLYTGAFLEGVALDWSSELEEWVYATREHLAERVQHALLNLAEDAAKGQDFGVAATFAERAYKLPGLGGSDVAILRRLYTLLCAGSSRLAPEVRKEAEGYGVTFKLTPEKARGKFKQTATKTMTATNTLPMRGTSFVGRDVELTELATLLSREKVSLLTLLGPAGVGKTRLALQLAFEQLKLGVFKDGVYFIPLDALSDPQLIPSTLINQLGLSQQAKGEPLEQIIDAIGERKMLLILDNFEHRGEGSGFLPPLLGKCPNLKLLVTSRERLRLEEAYIFPVEGLPYPARLAEDAVLSDAVQLFNARAQQAELRFDLERELEAVIRICRLVEGLPLGIELAAAWVRLMSCADIAEEITKNLEFLSGSTQNVPERHRSLKAAFESSWQLLVQNEQDVLKKLSVFRGGFRRDAAAAVAGATIPILASLVDQSLLRVTVRGRYDRHPLLYQYTQEKLAEMPDEGARVAAEHCAFFLSFVEAAEPELRGDRQSVHLERLEEEQENLRAALSWTLAQRETEAGLRLGGSLWYFWYIKGYAAEGLNWLEQLLRATNVERSTAYAKASRGAGVLAWVLSDYERACAFSEAGLAASRALGDTQGVEAALNNLGILAHEQGNYARARVLYEEVLAARRTINDKAGVSSILDNLGNIAVEQGDYASARTVHQESLELSREVGDARGIALSLGNLGVTALHQGDYDAARAYYEESLRVSRTLGDKSILPYNLRGLGLVALHQGNYDKAQSSYEESLSLCKGLGDEKGVAYSLLYLAEIALQQDDLPTAETNLKASLTIHQRVGDKQGIANSLGSLGRAASLAGDDHSAVSYHVESLRLHQEMGSKHGAIRALENLADVLARIGNGRKAARIGGAAEELRKALDLAKTPFEHNLHKQTKTAILTQLGETAFAAAWAEGRALGFEEAIRMCRDFNQKMLAQQPLKPSGAALE